MESIASRTTDLGGFSVRRVLPARQRRMVGPWIFFDHLGPVTFDPGQGIDVRPHPHIHLATVTYLFEGEIYHRDSLGCQQAILPGEINLMLAGKGIVHSERTRNEIRAQGHTLHALQLWLALPEAKEESDPAFYHYDAAVLPTWMESGVRVQVLMGQAYGLTSPVETFSETLYLDIQLDAGANFQLPDDIPECGLYILEGELQLEGKTLETCAMHVFDAPPPQALSAVNAVRAVMIGGAPLGQRHIFWNFVSSRKERIEQAKAQWLAEDFPLVPGDEFERGEMPVTR